MGEEGAFQPPPPTVDDRDVCKKLDLNILKIDRVRTILSQKFFFLKFFWNFQMADKNNDNSSTFEIFVNFFSLDGT